MPFLTVRPGYLSLLSEIFYLCSGAGLLCLYCLRVFHNLLGIRVTMPAFFSARHIFCLCRINPYLCPNDPSDKRIIILSPRECGNFCRQTKYGKPRRVAGPCPAQGFRKRNAVSMLRAWASCTCIAYGSSTTFAGYELQCPRFFSAREFKNDRVCPNFGCRTRAEP